MNDHSFQVGIFGEICASPPETLGEKLPTSTKSSQLESLHERVNESRRTSKDTRWTQLQNSHDRIDQTALIRDPLDSSKGTKMELQSPATPAVLRDTQRKIAEEPLSVEIVVSKDTSLPSAECQKTKKWIL